MDFRSSFSTEVNLSKPNSSSSPSQVSDQKNSPPPIMEEIILKITIKSDCNQYLVDGGDNLTCLNQRTFYHYFDADQLPARILDNGGDLKRYVAEKFRSYQYSRRMNAGPIPARAIDARSIANQVIGQWERMREEVDLSEFGRVVPLNVIVRLCHNLFIRNGWCKMVPASEAAVEKMLKRIGIEEIGEDDRSCAICLEEMTKEDEKEVSQLPCRHAFHEECIKKWFRNSHFCPNCRFQIPTN